MRGAPVTVPREIFQIADERLLFVAQARLHRHSVADRPGILRKERPVNDERWIGRHVEIRNVRVSSITSGNGFWISGTCNERLFVLPSDKIQAEIGQGQDVDITGVVLELPNGMKERIGDRHRDEDLHLYANQVERAQQQK
jgi:hypothetical protein